MCSNYVPVTEGDKLLSFFGVRRDPHHELPPELYPTHIGPFIRLVDGQRACEAGRFGLLPPWQRELQFGRHTYNARSETVHSKPSFSDSWRRGLRCVIPAAAVFEPRYNDDLTHERWRIEKADGTPFGIAGVYSQWFEHGVEKFSYAMLTVSGEGHPFYAQFHKPGDEKRMPIFLDPDEYDPWMSCPLAEAPRFFRQWQGAMKGEPHARPRAAAPRPKKAEPPPPAPPEPPVQGGLF
jgi:putative SOS response-associated peptidase YedK